MSKQPQQKPTPNIATMTATLRLQTCALLKLDPAALLPADEILVARAGALRLTVSDGEAALMRGETIAMPAYIAASQELETLFREAHHIEVTEGGDPRALVAAREKMAHLLGVILNEAPSEAEARRNAEIDDLKRCIADLENEIHDLKAERDAAFTSTGKGQSDGAQSQDHVKTPPQPQPQPAAPAPTNVVPISRSEPAYSPLVVNDAGSFLDSLNRKAW